MSFSTPASGLYLAKGVARQFYWTFGGWQGPLRFSPKLDRKLLAGPGPADDPAIIAMQWHGTGDTTAAGGGGPEWRYYMGIKNSSNCNIWFHLEGGGVT